MYFHRSSVGICLPGGDDHAYSWGNDINSTRANYNWDGGAVSGVDFKQTRDVGQYADNPWGFFDIQGNVWEWVSDWKANYPGGDQTNPEGPASGSLRVVRGGSWSNGGPHLRSAKAAWRPQQRPWLPCWFPKAIARGEKRGNSASLLFSLGNRVDCRVGFRNSSRNESLGRKDDGRLK